MRNLPNFKICGLFTPFSKKIPNRFFSKSPEVLTEGSGTKPQCWWGFRFLIKCGKLRGGVRGGVGTLLNNIQMYLNGLEEKTGYQPTKWQRPVNQHVSVIIAIFIT